MNAMLTMRTQSSEPVHATTAKSVLVDEVNPGHRQANLPQFDFSDMAGAAAVVSLPHCILQTATAAALEMLTGPGPLHIDGGALSATTSRGRTQLVRAVDAALLHGASSMAVIRDGRNSIGLWIAPLSIEQTPSAVAPTKYAVVDFMTEDATLSVEDFAPLAESFDLTEAEAEIARLLVIGFDLAEIAAVRLVKRTTVRNQCKAILTKLGCRRQIELVRLLTSLTRRAPKVFQIEMGKSVANWGAPSTRALVDRR